MTDSGSIIPWIISAAYLPFTFLYFLRLLRQPGFKTAIKLSLALSLLLTAGYPSFFVYTLYIMLAGFTGWLIINFKQKSKVKSFLAYSSVVVIGFLLICSPALLSWWDFSTYYERGRGTTLNRALTNSFPLFSAISYLIPSAVSKSHEWLKTDSVARNASAGIFIMIFFVLALFGKFTRAQKFIVAVIVFSFFFSLGGATPLREWSHQYLPFMNFFRHPASVRIFTTLGIILIAASAFNGLITEPAFPYKRLFIVTIIFALSLIGIALYYFPKTNLHQPGMMENNKAWLDSLKFNDVAVIQSLLQLFFVAGFFLLLRKKRTRLIPVLIITNSVIFCWMALPFTFISQVKTRTINQYIATVPHGFPLPDLKTSVKTGFFSATPTFDYRFLLTKTISIQDQVITPTINTSYIHFLDDTQLRQILHGYPFVYFSDSSIGSLNHSPPANASIQILNFNNNGFSLKTSLQKNATLNIFQQYHHDWQAKIDNKETPVFKCNKAFMSIGVPAGIHDILFIFQPSSLIKVSIYISAFTLLVIVTMFTIQFLKGKWSSA
jgi:hypothetical protein